MFYLSGIDDFTGLGDLGAVSLAAAQRKCTAAQTAYQKRVTAFQNQISKAKTQAAVTRIQTQANKVLQNLANKMQQACQQYQTIAQTPTPGLTTPGLPGVICPAGYVQDPTSGQCYPAGTNVGTVCPSGYGPGPAGPCSVYNPNQFQFQFPLGITSTPPPYAGQYVGQQMFYNGAYWSWTGSSWSSLGGSTAAPLQMPPWLQPVGGGGFGPTPYSPYYPSGSTYVSGSYATGYGYGYGGPLLTPIDEANQFTGAMYAPGYTPSYAPAAYPAPYGPELTPIDPSDISSEYPGYDVAAEDLQPGGAAPGFPPSPYGPTQPTQQCAQETTPATSDAYGPLQSLQVVCGTPTAVPSQSPTYDGQTITSVESSEIATMAGIHGLGRYIG